MLELCGAVISGIIEGLIILFALVMLYNIAVSLHRIERLLSKDSQ